MIPSMNIDRQYVSIQKELDDAALSVLHSGKYILGETVENFEKNFANYCGVKYAVGVGNGTDALVIALLSCGVKPGDEVITTAMSFFSTAEAIATVGAIPVFVDCAKDTFLIDSSEIEKAITNRTRAIIPVHLYGQCADMDTINDIARKNGLKVIEDTAQAAGATYKGKKAGSMGDAGCISFFPTKNLGAAGDGGMIITNDEDVFKQCQALRVHGSGTNGLFTYGKRNNIDICENDIDFNDNLPKYFNFVLGYNSRLDALQAAILDVKLKYLDDWNKRRREIAAQYNEIKNNKFVKPCVKEGNEHIYYVYYLTLEERDAFREYMKENGIATGVYFPVPLHLQRVFENLGYKKGDFPNAEFAAEHMVTIPMFPELSQDEITSIIKCVKNF